MNKVAEIVKLEEERRQLWNDDTEFDAQMETARKAKERQQELLSTVTLEEFEEARGQILRIRLKDSSAEVRTKMEEPCGQCGHRRGNHMSAPRRGCSIGSERHNLHYRRHDPPCFCSGFITRAEVVQAKKEQEEEEAAKAAMPFICSECDEAFEDDADFVRLYECGECGNIFSYEDNYSHRCEQCNKFAAKLTDNGCPECNQAAIVERGGDN